MVSGQTKKVRRVIGCPFCARVAAGEFDERHWTGAVTFEPLNPVTPGHRLVVPRQHVKDAAEDATVTAQVMLFAAELAAKVGSCNLITSIGATATQTVMHLHIHIVPRTEGDGLHLPWTGQKR